MMEEIHFFLSFFLIIIQQVLHNKENIGYSINYNTFKMPYSDFDFFAWKYTMLENVQGRGIFFSFKQNVYYQKQNTID